MGKQKPYGSKMEKFDVVGRSRGARNLPINIFINSTQMKGVKKPPSHIRLRAIHGLRCAAIPDLRPEVLNLSSVSSLFSY